jgi:hypothetical protein
VAESPNLIIQVPRDSAVQRQLAEGVPAGVGQGEVVVEIGPTDPQGTLEPSPGGEVVLSVPSPEALKRDAAEVKRVIAHAGTGTAPLVVVVQAAEELRQEELAPVLEASARAERPVILRVIRDA